MNRAGPRPDPYRTPTLTLSKSGSNVFYPIKLPKLDSCTDCTNIFSYKRIADLKGFSSFVLVFYLVCKGHWSVISHLFF